MTGFAATTLPGGIRFCALHYSADPEKNQEWVNRVKPAIDPDEWDREMELRENIWPGEKVFKAYSDSFHCPAWANKQDIQIVSGAHYIGGWDGGQTLAPAFVLEQLRKLGEEWRLYTMLEVSLEGAWSMEEFAPIVKERLHAWSPEFAPKIIHTGDPTIWTRSGTDKRSAGEVAQSHGFNIQPSTNDWEIRKSAVTWHLLRKLSDGRAGYILSGKNCPTLKAGFEGAYNYPKRTTADQSGPGMELQTPNKNQYSHVQDAKQYADILAKALIENSATVKQSSRIKKGNYRTF